MSIDQVLTQRVDRLEKEFKKFYDHMITTFDRRHMSMRLQKLEQAVKDIEKDINRKYWSPIITSVTSGDEVEDLAYNKIAKIMEGRSLVGGKVKEECALDIAKMIFAEGFRRHSASPEIKLDELREFIWERCEADDKKTDEIMAKISHLL